jgi:hypothetical protein
MPAAVMTVVANAIGIDPNRKARVALVRPRLTALRASRFSIARAGVSERDAEVSQQVVVHGRPIKLPSA